MMFYSTGYLWSQGGLFWSLWTLRACAWKHEMALSSHRHGDLMAHNVHLSPAQHRMFPGHRAGTYGSLPRQSSKSGHDGRGSSAPEKKKKTGTGAIAGRRHAKTHRESRVSAQSAFIASAHMCVCVCEFFVQMFPSTATTR